MCQDNNQKATLMMCAAAVLFSAALSDAAMDSRFEIDPKAIDSALVSTKTDTVRKSGIKKTAHRTGKPSASRSGWVVHTVSRNDDLAGMLVRRYGLSDAEAEQFMEDVRRENNIYDIRKLKPGQKIRIPPKGYRGSAASDFGAIRTPDRHDDSGGALSKSFNIAPPGTFQDNSRLSVTQVRDIWSRLVPDAPSAAQPISVNTPMFSLTLDPEQYPVFNTMDGGRIVLNQNGTIPPLVRSMLEQKDPKLRIIDESPLNARRLLSAMLAAGGFYSVEKDFSMSFGTDPKTSVHFDFKVEKKADSIVTNDVVLLSANYLTLPTSMGTLLRKEGFIVHEPFASSVVAARPYGTVHHINSKHQSELIEKILLSLSVHPEKNQSVEVLSAERTGISLSVRPEFLFTSKGKRVVVSRFDGDPVSYTLFRLLETKGYNVVIIEEKDGFKNIAEKISSKMGISGRYDFHNLTEPNTHYFKFQMSGFKATEPGGSDKVLFITNANMDSISTDLLTQSGYNVIEK